VIVFKSKNRDITDPKMKWRKRGKPENSGYGALKPWEECMPHRVKK
jgi:hypothetical protein